MPQPELITASELLLDERFLAWVAGELDSPGYAWVEGLRAVSDEQEGEVLEALMIHRAMVRQEVEIPDQSVQRARLMERLERESQELPATNRNSPGRKWMSAAWIPALLFIIGAAVWNFSASSGDVLVGDGKSTRLADGTKVTLSPSSTITYGSGLDAQRVREVWVKGEAQFEVKHLADNQPFVVHTPAFDIQVTGTRFIVKNDPEGASVLLQEGSVNLLFPDGEWVAMKPGDYFSLDHHKTKTESAVASTPEQLQRHIVFDNTPFAAVAREIEQRYEVQVQILTPGLGDKLITGILPNDDLPVLLRALESAMDCSIRQDKKTIYIKTAQ